MGRDTDATGGYAGGSAESETSGGIGGETGGDFGGLDYGGALSGGLGIGGISSAVADTVGREAFGGLAGGAGSFGGSDGRASSPSFGSADAAYSQSVHASAPDMSNQISSLVGKPVSRTDAGYVDDVGTRMAYSSGNPTSYGAQATARENDLGMSWNGAKAMNEAAIDARAAARTARAREIQAKTTAALKDPVAMGLDPHMAKAAYDDAMHGMYGKAVSVGAMTAEEAKAVQEAYGGVAGALGFGLDDVTTPYESFVDSVAQGLVDPVTGKLTTKGWANVAAPAIGLLAGPLAQLGFSAFGLPGAIAGAMAPAAINAMSAPKKSTGLDTAADFAGHVTGIDASPFAAAAAWGDTMNTMGMAQNYAGTQPEKVSGIGGQTGGDSTFLQGMAQFFTRGTRQKSDGTNPQFKKRFDSRFADRSRSSTSQPVQTQTGQPQVTKQSILGPDFLAGFKPFFRRA